MAKKSKFELALERMNKHGATSGSKTEYVKVADGEHAVLRILPEVGNMEIPWQIIGRHYFDRAANSILCPAFTTEEEEECVLCEMRIAAVNAQEKEIPKFLNVRKQYQFNVIERKMLYGEANEQGRKEAVLRWYEGPKVWTPGILAFNALNRIVTDPEYGEVWNLDAGIDIRLGRTGEGMATEWGVNPARNTSPVFTEGFDFELDGNGPENSEWNTPANLEKVLEQRLDLSRVKGRLPDEAELLEKAGLSGGSENEDDWVS